MCGLLSRKKKGEIDRKRDEKNLASIRARSTGIMRISCKTQSTVKKYIYVYIYTLSLAALFVHQCFSHIRLLHFKRIRY